MVNLFSNKFEILIFLTCVIDISRGYQKLSIEDDDLCSPTTKGNITPGIGKLSALILSLGNITALKEQEDKWEDDFTCEFQISIPQTHQGIFAVIQNIVFRKNHTTNECIDYVQYKRYDGTLSGKYCGQMGIDYKFQANDSLITTNSFVEHYGRLLNVYINISKSPLDPDENLQLEIVFSSFRNCFKNFSVLDRGSWCWEGYTTHCVAKSFTRDGYYNCPHYRCTDEGGCSQFESETPFSTSQQGGAYTGLFIFLGIAIAAVVTIGISWKLRRYCGCIPENAVEPTVTENAQHIEMNPMPEVAANPRSYDCSYPS